MIETIEVMIEQYGDFIMAVLGVLSIFLTWRVTIQNTKIGKQEEKTKIQDVKLAEIQSEHKEKVKRQDIKLAEIQSENKETLSLIEVISKQAESTATLAKNINDMNHASRENSQQMTTAINTLEATTSQKMQTLDATITRFSNEIENLTTQLKELPNKINTTHELERKKLVEVIDTLRSTANKVIEKIEKSELKLESKQVKTIIENKAKGKASQEIKKLLHTLSNVKKA